MRKDLRGNQHKDFFDLRNYKMKRVADDRGKNEGEEDELKEEVKNDQEDTKDKLETQEEPNISNQNNEKKDEALSFSTMDGKIQNAIDSYKTDFKNSVFYTEKIPDVEENWNNIAEKIKESYEYLKKVCVKNYDETKQELEKYVDIVCNILKEITEQKTEEDFKKFHRETIRLQDDVLDIAENIKETIGINIQQTHKVLKGDETSGIETIRHIEKELARFDTREIIFLDQRKIDDLNVNDRDSYDQYDKFIMSFEISTGLIGKLRENVSVHLKDGVLDENSVKESYEKSSAQVDSAIVEQLKNNILGNKKLIGKDVDQGNFSDKTKPGSRIYIFYAFKNFIDEFNRLAKVGQISHDVVSELEDRITSVGNELSSYTQSFIEQNNKEFSQEEKNESWAESVSNKMTLYSELVDIFSFVKRNGLSMLEPFIVDIDMEFKRSIIPNEITGKNFNGPVGEKAGSEYLTKVLGLSESDAKNIWLQGRGRTPTQRQQTGSPFGKPFTVLIEEALQSNNNVEQYETFLPKLKGYIYNKKLSQKNPNWESLLESLTLLVNEINHSDNLINEFNKVIFKIVKEDISGAESSIDDLKEAVRQEYVSEEEDSESYGKVIISKIDQVSSILSNIKNGSSEKSDSKKEAFMKNDEKLLKMAFTTKKSSFFVKKMSDKK